MNDMLDMQWMAMQFKFGLLLGLSAWALALNFSFGLVNTALKELAEKIIPEDHDRINSIFQSKTYRIIAWLLDKLARIKMPEQGKKKSTGNTDVLTKPPTPAI